MTSSSARLLVRAPRRTLRADPLLVTLLLCAVAGVAALGFAGAPAAGSRAAGTAAPRVALVVDAAGRPHAALDRARAAAARSRGADVAVRVPRTAAEAAADVRYFAAQRYGAVVAVGPLAGRAARAAAPEFPRTRFASRSALP
jgi:basic membrane lipoprotein Med (substrate-binding protein (PBP1-ABC) superfamily)